jgi:hypothetical protein
MARRCTGTPKHSWFKAASLVLVLFALVFAVGSSFALDGSNGNSYVNYHRDRLLDTYAQYKGFGNRVNAWNSLNYKQKMLFLIQTDLLGNRTFMHPTRTNYYKNNPEDGCNNGQEMCSSCSISGGQRWCGSCQVWIDQPMDDTHPQINGCWSIDAYDCYQRGLCREAPQQRTDYEMALEHVTKLYEILAPNDGCGGADNNRIFWQAGTNSSNDQLIQAFRNRTMPGWGRNADLGGNHSPFDNSSATTNGRPDACDGPDGQAQFYSWDTVCTYGGQKGCSSIQAFWRGSAYLPADSRMFELDDDYNCFLDGFTLGHDSSPLCHYCGGQYGVTMYEQHWCPSQGNFASCDWNYTPTPVNYPLSVSKTGTGSGTVTSAPAGINCGSTCSANYSSGTWVTLTASAGSGSTFAGWSGPCSGTGTCMVSMAAAQSVTATFNQAAQSSNAYYCYSNSYSSYGFQNWLCNAAYNPTYCYTSNWQWTTCPSAPQQSNAYYCYSNSYPSYGYQNWLCNVAYNPTYCYTSNWQSTSCPSSGSTSQCGNGICETGENGSNCGQDCCDQSTACGQTKQNQGSYYCRNMYYYDNGSAYWHGFKWVTANDTMQMCNDSWEAWEGSYYQTQYQCGSYTGKCHSIPGGYY